MKIKDIIYIDGLTGELLDNPEPTREIVNVQSFDNGSVKMWTVFPEDLIHYYAWKYARDNGIMDYDEFLNHCVACGGAWTSMLITGIKEVFPKVWEALDPNKMYSFFEIVDLLEECGVVINPD